MHPLNIFYWALLLMSIIAIETVTLHPFNMYYTHEVTEELQHDCLLYTVLDDIVLYEKTLLPQHQFILYCFRPMKETNTSQSNRMARELNNNASMSSLLSFEQLKIKNITPMDLFAWSIPLDLIEHYAAYLINNADTNDESRSLLYNCTPPWFGPVCQYTFDSNSSFSTIVRSVFTERFHLYTEPTNQNTSCYIHLPCEYRSWAPMCLDWREICDGKVDCIDSGIDEANCFDLEKNECEENEYRCQNGLCIPQELLHDDGYNPECLDQTDEPPVNYYPSRCEQDPSFRCEEHACRISNEKLQEFPCGDGSCLPSSSSCDNRRHSWGHRILKYFEVNDLCSIGMFCLTRPPIHSNFDYDKLCDKLTVLATQHLVQKHCPSLFDFPYGFLLYGHVRFLYRNNNMTSVIGRYILPAYVCYKKELCEFIPPTIVLTMSNNDSMTCRHFHELNLTASSYGYDYWMNMVLRTAKFFRVCTSIKNNIYYPQDTASLFQCPNSTKYISKHRLVDGIRDCAGNEDESYRYSCALNDKYRFKCQADGRCLAPTLVGDYNIDCNDSSDEEIKPSSEHRIRISFQTLCDGFVELSPLIVNGREETDETDCEYWPCNNTYTRCDEVWNCPTGADEVNCPSLPICPPFEHICISPITLNVTCLAIDKANNDEVDCLGGTDERRYCREKYPKWPDRRFLCNKNTDECIHRTDFCNSKHDCSSGEDEQYCPSQSRDVCSLSQHDNSKLDIGEKFLCTLTDIHKPKMVYFALKNFPNHPLSSLPTKQKPHLHINYTIPLITQTVSHLPLISWLRTWRCNRGISIRFHNEYKCLCPPSYYGAQCEYQNQRVSLTIRARVEAEWRTLFTFLITLIDDDEHAINSYDQFSYLAVRDCNTKFNMYLLYADRSKNASKNYFIRIDVFDRHSLTHRASWFYPLRFSFLPVHRTAVYLLIPWMKMPSREHCRLHCGHGHCIHPVNNPKTSLCQCDHGWSGKECDIEEECHCSPQSLCLGSLNDRSVCLCPIGMFGSRCFLSQTVCQSQPCQYDGQCIPNDYGRRGQEYSCICKEGYSGDACERIDTRIEISFHSNINIPSSLMVHLITVNRKARPTRTTLFGKIGFHQSNAILYTSVQFRLILTEFDDKYYFTFHQSQQTYLENMSTMIIPSHRCLSINELFNSTVVEYHLLRRLKYYHLPCFQHLHLVCFYDSLYICLCKMDRHSDCLEFDRNATSNHCQGPKICLYDGECYQDNQTCPTASFCACKDCFYGRRCQYSTKRFDLSLDVILGYHIQTSVTFLQQSIIVKVTCVLVSLMFATGLINGICSIITFQAKNSQKSGCGMYLLYASILSVVLIVTLLFKVILLIVSHMGLITRRSFLSGNCLTTDFVLRILLYASDWLNACVTTERAVSILKGIHFDMEKSRRVSRYVIVFVFLLVITSTLHDPFHRQLVDDLEDDAIWCVVNYSDWFVMYNSVVQVFHFVIPFLINIISAILIIILVSRQRSKAHKQSTQRVHFRDQLHQHKHLLISPCILTVLGLPRLIMTFLSGCMSSSRQSWFFLFGYFISFVPPILTFLVFVFPSETYRREFLSSIKRRSMFCR
jgi:hypothetical protein